MRRRQFMGAASCCGLAVLAYLLSSCGTVSVVAAQEGARDWAGVNQRQFSTSPQAGQAEMQGQGQPRQARQGSPRNLGLSLSSVQGGQMRIDNVAPNSAAARIGLQQGDQIVSVGGQQISNEQQLN